MFGRINFTAADSFDAILGEPSGPIFGGGARVGLPWGGLFVDVGAWRFHADGERAFVFNDEVIPLGIPVDVTVTPIESAPAGDSASASCRSWSRTPRAASRR